MIDAIASLVRDEAERYARACGYDASLEGWCGIVSGALVLTLSDAGFHAELAGGWMVIGDYEVGHFWALVAPSYAVPAEQWSTYATLLDLTATQFQMIDVPQVVRLDAGDERRRMYALCRVGFEECLGRMPEADLGHLEVLAARCRTARSLRGAA